MTVPIPSERLPSSVAPDATIIERTDRRITRLDDELRMCASADLINGVRPATRAEAEAMVVRAQRDHLARRVEELRAQLAPMQLVVQALTALAYRSVGREVVVTDAEIDDAATRTFEFKRTGPGAAPGWIADTLPMRLPSIGRQEIRDQLNLKEGS
jgi:hypothetical protein